MNICPVCNKPSGFNPNGREKIHCSRNCYTQSRKRGETISCKRCGKHFYRHLSVKDTKKFCSLECSNKSTSNGSKRKNGKFISCPTCGKSRYFALSHFNNLKNKLKFCSIHCRAIAMKDGKTPWGFDKSENPTGENAYKRIWRNGRRIKEHRWIMQQHLGRSLLKSEVVHHINGDPTDNRLENLQLTTPQEHGRIHKTKKLKVKCLENKSQKR